MKGITNANNVANSEVNAKQPLLVSGENIKTVNGNSLLGAGNIAVETYQPFPAGWRTNGTINELMADITADASAVVGMAYLGEIRCSDMPFVGNGELIVNIMNGSGSSKVIWATLSSGNVSPYYWHYTYWNTQGSGWRSYIPSDINSGALVTGIGYDANGNLVKGSIPQPEGFTTQEMETICDDILYPALPAPTNVQASGTTISFDEVPGAESYEVYANGTEIGEFVPTPTPAEEYFLTFSSISPFEIRAYGWDGVIEYSTDKETWNEWDGSDIESGSNNELYFRGTGNTVITGGISWTLNSYNGDGISCTGNIETLLDYQTVMEGQHPFMAQSCYANMFEGCTLLTAAPELPATILTDYCYAMMFYGCTSLTQAPGLPATILSNGCYSNMFRDCTLLTQAPALPATTLADYCYSSMFNGCTSLTTAPVLPATRLNYYCYHHMFDSCTSLYVSDTQTPEAQYKWRIPTNAVITGTTYSQSDMFANCLGTRASDNLSGEVGQQYIYYTQNEPAL